MEDYVKRANELGLSAVALTDHGTMAGLLKLYHESKKHNIKPIMGSELYIANRSRFQKENGIDGYHHITLIAMNKTGWKNLNYLIGESYSPESFYKRPRIDRDLLRKHNEGLICLSGCFGGHLAKQIKWTIGRDYDLFYKKANELVINHGHDENNYMFLQETPEEIVQWYKNVFGDRYYIEVQNHHIGKVEEEVNDYLYSLANKYNIKTVATGDSHYVYEKDRKVHNIMLLSRNKTTIKETPEKEIQYPGTGYHLMSSEEMFANFSGHEEAVKNTLEIADRCNIEFKFNDFKLPKIVEPEKEDLHLASMVEKGLEQRYGKPLPNEVISRAQTELDTIFKMNVSSYFLLVADFVNWCKNNNIPTNIARGSAGGSVVTYALGITELDPLKYDLLFSRFLNRGRAAIPVIDFDEFPLEEWKMKKYLHNK